MDTETAEDAASDAKPAAVEDSADEVDHDEVEDDVGEDEVSEAPLRADGGELGLVLRVDLGDGDEGIEADEVSSSAEGDEANLEPKADAEDEGGHRGDEPGEERVEGERAHQAAVEELRRKILFRRE